MKICLNFTKPNDREIQTADLVLLSFKNGWFFPGSEFLGCVDYGDEAPSDEPATTALVMMVVAQNASFKMPFAHFFTRSTNGQGKPFFY